MSEAMTIACPSCEQKFKGKPELRGKKVRCPACTHAFVVPAAAAEPNRAALATKKTSPTKGGATPANKSKAPGKGKPSAATATAGKRPATHDDDDDGPNKYGVTDLDLAPRCPHCANEMESEDAVICLFCGYNTETREIGKTTTVYGIRGSEHFMWLLPGLGSALALVLVVAWCFYFALVLPKTVDPKSWWAYLDHESMRMWNTLICLAVMWPAGFFAFKRLIMEPKPKEKKKE